MESWKIWHLYLGDICRSQKMYLKVIFTTKTKLLCQRFSQRPVFADKPPLCETPTFQFRNVADENPLCEPFQSEHFLLSGFEKLQLTKTFSTSWTCPSLKFCPVTHVKGICETLCYGIMSFCWISGSTQTTSTTTAFCREIQCLHFYWKPYCFSRRESVNIWICTIIETVRSPVAIFCPFNKESNNITLIYSEKGALVSTWTHECVHVFVRWTNE